jgi:porin
MELARVLALVFSTATLWADPQIGQNEDPHLSSWISAAGVTGSWGGQREALINHGVEVFGSYTAEVWGNTTGGLKQGALYTGLLAFGLNVDLDKAVGWNGGSLNITWLWLSGGDASEELAGNFLTISNIAGFNTLRLFQLWFQQDLFDDKISLQVGQISVDTEFVISDYAATFINSTFGWPASMYMNLPEGGLVYPVGALGVRLAINPVDWFTFQSAITQGNVYPEDINRYGFRWWLDVNNGCFFINEAQFRWNQWQEGKGLSGQFKSGAWFHTAQFANPLNGNLLFGNCGFYFIVDQMLYRKPDEAAAAAKGGKSALTKESEQGLGWFGRIAFGPQDRNFIGFYLDTGVTYKGLVPGRDKDTIGIAFAYAQLTQGARHAAIISGSTGVGAEMNFEVTYQAQITRWLSIQPDLQFVINPGGNQDLKNALVIGLRTAITF